MHATRPIRSIATLAGLAAAVIMAAATTPRAPADQVVLTSVADNTLIEDPAGAFSSGVSTYFFAGRVGVNGGSTRRRGALRFDLSSIPAGSTVTSVTLKMYCSAAGTTTSYAIGLRRFTKSWGEGASQAFGGGGAPSEPNDATWLHRFYGTSQTWTSSGGDFASTTSASRAVTGTGSYTWASTAALVSDVQGWIDVPATNFGWCVLGNETTDQSVKRFDSREASLASYRPQLTVVYNPPSSNPLDLDHDGKVNAADLAILLAAWGGAGAADFDASGAVDAADLSALLGGWTG